MTGPSSATTLQPNSAFKISETILRTGRIDEMKAWYTRLLGVGPFFDHAPVPGTTPGDYGGQTRASDLRMCFFRLGIDYPAVQSIGLFEEPGTLPAAPKSAPGLHHMQLMADDHDALCAKYESLRDAGLQPHRAADHGVMTSFYYRDPDGNNVEITAQNFPTFETMAAFMASAEFAANPSGAEIEPEVWIAARKQRVSPER